MAVASLLAALLVSASPSVAPAANAAPVQMAQATPGRAVRQIAPDVIAPPIVDGNNLEREEPRAPLSDLGRAGPLPEKSRKETEKGVPQLFQPVAVAAGRIETQGMTVVIAGIEIVEPDRTCRGMDGTDWPCGTMARTAFRSFLRGRALDCDLPEGPLPQRIATACRLGGRDVGAWLVSNGWAKVSSTGPYAQEQAEAIEARRGIFGTGPAALPENGLTLPASQLPAGGDLLAPGTLPPQGNGAAGDAAQGGFGTLPPQEPIERQPIPEPKGLY